MPASTTVTLKTILQHQLFTLYFMFKLFHVSVAVASIESQKILCCKFLVNILTSWRNLIKIRWSHRWTGRCDILTITTWAAWFWATQGRLLTKKKEERKGRKGKKKKERKKEKEKKRKKEKRRKGRRLETGLVIPCLGFVRHCIQGP